jgi:hypothetical protein
MKRFVTHDYTAALFGVSQAVDTLKDCGVHHDAIIVAIGQVAAEHFRDMPEAERSLALTLWAQGLLETAYAPVITDDIMKEAS